MCYEDVHEAAAFGVVRLISGLIGRELVHQVSHHVQHLFIIAQARISCYKVVKNRKAHLGIKLHLFSSPLLDSRNKNIST